MTPTPPGWPLVPVDRAVRAVLVGAGGMGVTWARTLADTDAIDLAGWVDIDGDRLASAASELVGAEPIIGTSLADMIATAAADLVVDVTSPDAHRAVTEQALALGVAVLGEKPMATTMGDALAMVAAADATGGLFVVSQNRRHDRNVRRLKAAVASLGRVGVVDAGFYRAPHFPGFRETMAHPLLLDMAIHAADTARYLLPSEPVAVVCDAFSPAWSWYAGAAAATAVFELADGARFTYRGCWCADGLETSWNGYWRIVGEHGTATWDGDAAPVAHVGNGPPQPMEDDAVTPPRGGLDGVIDDVVEALRTGVAPPNECHDNVTTLAMVHAAARSSDERRRVEIAEVLAVRTG